jgi:hypothetical protein
MCSTPESSSSPFPDLVRVVLLEAHRYYRQGMITSRTFKWQVARVAREELSPHGWDLEIDEESEGSIRFIMRSAATGEVHAILDPAS